MSRKYNHPHPNPQHVMSCYRTCILKWKKQKGTARGLVHYKDLLQEYLAAKDYVIRIRRGFFYMCVLVEIAEELQKKEEADRQALDEQYYDFFNPEEDHCTHCGQLLSVCNCDGGVGPNWL